MEVQLYDPPQVDGFHVVSAAPICPKTALIYQVLRQWSPQGAQAEQCHREARSRVRSMRWLLIVQRQTEQHRGLQHMQQKGQLCQVVPLQIMPSAGSWGGTGTLQRRNWHSIKE